MKSLREILEKADTGKSAVGHFVSDLVTLKAVFEAARGLKVPVIVGVSEREPQFMGVRQVAAVVKSLRDEYDFPIFLNADHTHSLPSGMEAARAGFDWVAFDLSALPFEENIRQTKAAVRVGRSRIRWNASPSDHNSPDSKTYGKSSGFPVLPGVRKCPEEQAPT